VGQTSPPPLTTPYSTPIQAFLAQQSDCNDGFSTRALARVAAAASDNPVYRYVFAHTYENTGDLDENNFLPAQQGAGYGLDAAFLFNTFTYYGPDIDFSHYLWGAYTPNPDELVLANQMAD